MTQAKKYRLAVFSDTHGNYGAIEKSLPIINACDYFVYLGDGNRDVDKVQDKITAQIVRVQGNCDVLSPYPAEVVLTVGETDFLVTHGNNYSVKSSLLSLASRARECGCGYALYGHTHTAKVFDAGGVICINPGTASRCSKASFAVIEGDGSLFSTDFVSL